MSERPADPVELLAVVLVDARAAVDGVKRSVAIAQSSVEQLRTERNRLFTEDIADAIAEAEDGLDDLRERVLEAKTTLESLIETLWPSDEPPETLTT